MTTVKGWVLKGIGAGLLVAGDVDAILLMFSNVDLSVAELWLRHSEAIVIDTALTLCGMAIIWWGGQQVHQNFVIRR